MFGLAAACAVAGAGGWSLLAARKQPAKTAEQHDDHTHTPDAGNKLPPAAPKTPSPTVAHHLHDDQHDDLAEAPGPHHDAPAGQLEPPAMTPEESPSSHPPAGRLKSMPLAAARLTEKNEKRRASDILRADDEFREGKIAAAMKLYGAAIEAHPSVLDPMVQFRWALCAEALGLLDEAAERYQMLADATSAPSWRGFAQWGLSRVLFEQQKTELAHRIAADLWLNQEHAAPLWRSELLHWHAHLLYRRASGDTSSRLLEDNALIGCKIVVRPFDLLDIASRIHASETAAPFQPPPAPSLPMTTGTDPAAMYAQYKSGGATVYDAVQQFCGAAHWQVEWSNAAQQLAKSHRCRASVGRGSIACLLDALCDQPRLIWNWENQVLRISEVAERSTSDWKQYQLKAAERAAREALSLYRDVRWSPYSRLAIAHVEALSGLQAASRKSLEDLIANSPKGDLLAEAWFNLGKIQLQENAADKAILAFQRSLDHAMGSGLEPLANLYLGRLLVEANEARRAVVPLRRSLALAAPRDRGTAALTLGTAYLLSSQPQNTAEILRANQNWLDVEGTRDATAFMSCLAQVQGGHDPTRLKYDLRSLMTSISHVRSEQFFGHSGAVLIAIAYRELGLNGEASDICRNAIAHMPPCALRMKLELMLVDELFDRRDFDGMEAQLRAVCETTNEEVRLVAYQRLCELLLELDRRDEAEVEARTWLKLCSSREQQAEALRGLGRCLQRKGDYLNAALCFSGSMPQHSAAEAPVTTNTAHP
ncbi:Tetratricopeptide repeat protein [Caulifigura coniformis]|uniref:Tetratricopeptide repeat protein n=2 Tax=Caulifigura coniformis TaxID=2527983 RepID=A0A517SCD8_9PLAN|nr:Tetratricopeptide repeat protein [Caulifigura coniformis]